MHTVTAVAHRGDPYRFRENTLPSLGSALDRGADAVEVDVRLTRDGVPVLLHDATLERLWRHDAPLAALRAAEVAELTGGGVPTLAAALTAVAERDAAGEGARVLVDLPDASSATARRVLGVVRDCGAADRVYYCGGAEAMLAVRAADPGAEIALTWTSLAPPRPVLLDAVSPRWLNYRFSLVDGALAARVHAHGLLLSAWTPDTRRSMRRLLALGADALTTNRVEILQALRTGRDGAGPSRARDAG
ncbi:glycerophosphoryl diester phosphodiesterase [Streptomyces sulfonofaciens]|uniref:Glycerophosphoryl diester phosphodiesterase n=1 Tax=Streptomyces sulfonofaciens TaxID=68272 RepID=A0A919GKY2_9ACTN|nr:glycerophosphodiester phosphodiesterase [Streptomyces sulfonofaciens]GHH86557.1 glycerophosphoryl diester phosphodiesterase [Streptomyces sulfonofaciens]